MNWSQIEGKWKELKGSAQAKWGEITDNDWHEVQGDKEKLEGKLQQKYGLTKEKAAEQVNEWRESH